MTPVDYLVSAAAAIAAALAFIAARNAVRARRRWMHLAVLSFVLFLECFTVTDPVWFPPIRVARDLACAWLLLEMLRPGKAPRPENLSRN